MTATTVAKSSEEVPPARGLPLYLHPPFPHGPERKGEGAGLGCGGRAAHDDSSAPDVVFGRGASSMDRHPPLAISPWRLRPRSLLAV
ncbi:hypothetical protein OsJ_01094 [Oryza sativa Japonica Group]|uniref:Uncharacterized protein n=1 Tax=Oryza sativa subsp. japonica TaxID=39947 RepID=B9EUN9_ORYSJ|nr:hypothetical protein OsJ_01094 [Oryza sativa Japonica Group]